jgi:hypothetical protein
MFRLACVLTALPVAALRPEASRATGVPVPRVEEGQP